MSAGSTAGLVVDTIPRCHSRLEIPKYPETIGNSVRLWGDKAALGCPLEDAQSVKAFRQIFFQPPRIERSD